MIQFILAPLNIASILLLLHTSYRFLIAKPFGYRLLGFAYAIPICLASFSIDFILRQSFANNLYPLLIELFILAVLVFWKMWLNRAKTFIIPDERSFEFVHNIYGVSNAKPLPVNKLTWRYKIEIPDNGITVTSTDINSDLPNTKLFTKSGLSLQDNKNSMSFCFAKVHSGQVEYESKLYNYQTWKIGRKGEITFSSSELKEIEKELLASLGKIIIEPYSRR